LKSQDANLRFLFITGVTKFSRVSIFSDLNQLEDISLDENFADICGLSEAELIENFQPEIQSLSDKHQMTYHEVFKKLKKYYDGYHFAKMSADIYNPFSALNAFKKLDFGYYWFQTGTPTFLTKLLSEQNFDIRKFENGDIEITAIELMDYRFENQNLIPVLYQAGYLTIKSYIKEDNCYILGYPNEEVKYGFLHELLPAFVLDPVTSGNFSVINFRRQLRDGDVEAFMISLKAFFAAIPYDAIKKENRNEQYYHHVFYLIFVLMEQYVETEVKSSKGRADVVVKTANDIFVFEFKMETGGTAQTALEQINSKDYSIPYIADHRRLVKIGVEFSIEEKGIKDWIIE
jgi:hypothetical protein